VVQEYIRGGRLGDKFPKLPEIQKTEVLEQVGQVLMMIQSYPPNVTGFGGLNFGEEGKVATGGLTIWFGGPFTKYTGMYLYVFQKQLELSKTTPLLTLVHGDLSLENIPFDLETIQLTELLDFDFTHIASPGGEYLYSFVDFHGITPGPFEVAGMEKLRLAHLNGFKDKQLEGPFGEAEPDWKTAGIWQAAVEKSGMRALADIGVSASLLLFTDFCLTSTRHTFATTVVEEESRRAAVGSEEGDLSKLGRVSQETDH
ncbi:hypothetical protein B0O99DRAFT_730815, partial [Bisporella sp. PMI_857]